MTGNDLYQIAVLYNRYILGSVTLVCHVRLYSFEREFDDGFVIAQLRMLSHSICFVNCARADEDPRS